MLLSCYKNYKVIFLFHYKNQRLLWGMLEPKFVTETYVEECNTFSPYATACSELGECSGDVSVNACLAHIVFPIDHFWMCNTGLDDSVQPMFVRTTLALKMAVCVSRM